MRTRFFLLILLVFSTVKFIYADEVIGEAFNPCGEPYRLTVTNYKETPTGITFNGHKYPVGFYFFYKTDNAEEMHKLWQNLKDVVKKMADEEKIDISKKCDFSGTITYVDENRFGVLEK